MASSSLLVLSNPDVKRMKFEDLLRAPAELLGRGKHGSTNKVTPNSGLILAVKRIKDWGISVQNFKKRMQRIGQVTHPKVILVLAYYCSKQEKSLGYDYQRNGSLLSLLQGSQNGQICDWGSRLNVAATIAESLAFMHDKLHADEIAHGNLKSSNILRNDKMEPCIIEYGLMVVENYIQANTLKTADPTSGRAYATFKVDIYAFGVILLVLLTRRLVQNTGFDLDEWVHSVVKEEWTVEVFDKSVTSEGDATGATAGYLSETIAGKGPFKTVVANPWSSRAGMSSLRSHIVLVSHDSKLISRICDDEERSGIWDSNVLVLEGDSEYISMILTAFLDERGVTFDLEDKVVLWERGIVMD